MRHMTKNTAAWKRPQLKSDLLPLERDERKLGDVYFFHPCSFELDSGPGVGS